MAKSKAKKLREKLVRSGSMNPEAKRSPFAFSDLRTRTTKTKKDYQYQYKNQNHHFQEEGKDGSFYVHRQCFLLLHPITINFFCMEFFKRRFLYV